MAGGTICRIWWAVFVMSFMCGWHCCMGAQGVATFYNHYVPSACYGNDTSQFPPGNLIAAASDEIWDSNAACGRQYRITCTGATNPDIHKPCKGESIVVKIVDYCPPGCNGTIDLSQEAFADIAYPVAGKIYINYEQV